MKTIKCILLIITLLVMSCTEDNTIVPLLDVSSTNPITFTAVPNIDEAVTITVTTNQNQWSVQSDQTWCKVTKNVATNTFTVMAETNTSLKAPPTAIITVTAGTATPINITVNQEGEPIEMSSIADYMLEATEGKFTLPLTTNVEYEVTSTEEWIKYTGTKTVTTKQLQLSYEKHIGANPRNATVTIKQKDGDLNRSFIIFQLPATPNKIIDLQNDASLIVDKESQVILIKTTDAVTSVDIADESTWLQKVQIGEIPTKSGAENTIRLLVDVNVGDGPRSANVVLKQGSKSEEVVITQGGTATIMHKITFANVNNNAGTVHIVTDRDNKIILPLANDKSVQLMNIGKILSAEFIHKTDGKTVVDWWSHSEGKELNSPLTLDLKDFAGGDGTENSPFLVSTPRHIQNLANYNNQNTFFKQINDVDMTHATGRYPNADYTRLDESKNNPNAPYFYFGHKSIYAYDGNNFSILGYRTNEGRFFDEIRHSIKNLTMDATSLTFREVGGSSSGIVSNLKRGAVMENCASYQTVITEGNTAAGLLLVNDGGIVKDCIFDGKLIGINNNTSLAGICFQTGSDVTFSNCINKASFQSKREAAGIVGLLNGKNSRIINCLNSGNISTDQNYIGGIVCLASVGDGASEYLEITNCENRGDITGGNASNGNTGGICGNISTGGSVVSTLKDCINRGKITTKSGYMGGIIGLATSTGNRTSQLEIKNCKNYGIVKQTERGEIVVGGIAGQISNSKMYECENRAEVISNWKAGGITGNNHSGMIENCHNYAKVMNTPQPYTGYNYNEIATGGIAATTFGSGPEYGAIINCSNNGVVINGRYVGGITGYNYGGDVVGCVNRAKVTGQNYRQLLANYEYDGAGGLVGYRPSLGSNFSTTIVDSYNRGDVAGGYCAGGIMGMGAPLCHEVYNTGIVSSGTGVIGCIGSTIYYRDEDYYKLESQYYTYWSKVYDINNPYLGGYTAGDGIISALVRNKSPQKPGTALLALINVNGAFKADTNNKNDGWPRLVWEK